MHVVMGQIIIVTMHEWLVEYYDWECLSLSFAGSYIVH